MMESLEGGLIDNRLQVIVLFSVGSQDFLGILNRLD
jgi:hypothetical protein